MKKTLFTALILAALSTSTLYAATPPTHLLVNDKPVALSQEASKDLTRLPLRAISDLLGYKTSWDSGAKLLTLTTPSRTITLAPNSSTYTLNSSITCHLASPVMLIDNTLYSPVSFWEDALGVKVTLGDNTLSLTDKLSPSDMLDDIVMPLNEGENTYYVNQKLGLSLEENPSTGYSWIVDMPLGIQVVSDNYTPGASDLMGAPGTHSWLIRATAPGTYTLVLKKVRPWEPTQPIETKTYILNAKTFEIPK